MVIVNTKAGGGSAGRMWKHAEAFLISAGIKFTAKFTKAPAQTRLLASNASGLGFDGVAVYGGDGTVSDAAAAISTLENKPVLAFLPAGSGNDWFRSLGFENATVEDCVAAIAKGITKKVDTGLCLWPGGGRFFLNSAGVGFDALVLRRAVNSRRFLPFGSMNYLLSLAASAVVPPRWKATILCDGKPFYKGDYLTVTTGIGRYSGGGMQLSPAAVPDDGLLDSAVVSPMNFFGIATHISNLYDGTLLSTKYATAVRGSAIRIEPFKPGSILLELDGEVVDPGAASEYIELISKPSDLTVIVPPPE
jgi:YegS/Rv2252/BmrU family lipid kinase